jgi:hypothetical protein
MERICKYPNSKKDDLKVNMFTFKNNNMRIVALVLVLIVVSICETRKVHLEGLSDIGNLKLNDLLQMVLPIYNTVKDNVNTTSIKDSLGGIASIVGEGGRTVVNTFQEAGGFKGIADTVTTKAG